MYGNAPHLHYTTLLKTSNIQYKMVIETSLDWSCFETWWPLHESIDGRMKVNQHEEAEDYRCYSIYQKVMAMLHSREQLKKGKNWDKVNWCQKPALQQKTECIPITHGKSTALSVRSASFVVQEHKPCQVSAEYRVANRMISWTKRHTRVVLQVDVEESTAPLRAVDAS